MRTSSGRLCAAALFLLAATAHAEGENARQWFESGKKHRDEGECPKAIPDFEKSIAIERSIGALYNLGFCHEQLGHRQEAYAAYRSARHLASDKKDDRLREISGALASLLESPHIRLALPYPLPPGLTITVDDQVVAPSTDQAETVVFTKDGKTHNVVVAAPGYDARRETVETKQLKAIELRKAEDKAPPVAIERQVGPWHWQRWLGVGVGALGVSAFVFGAIEGVTYLSKRSDIDARMDRFPCAKESPPRCREEDATPELRSVKKDNDDLVDAEGEWQLRSIVPLVVGSVAIGAGIALFVTAPVSSVTRHPEGAGASSTSTANVRVVPNVGQREQGLSVVGTF